MAINWYWSYLILLLGTGLYGLARYRSLPPPFRLLVQLVMWAFVTECGSQLLPQTTGSNYPVYHVFLVVSLVYYGLIYRKLLPQRKAFLYLNLGFMAFCVTVAIGNIFHHGHIFFFPSLGLICVSLFIITHSLMLFASMLRAPDPRPILHNPVFWFNSASLYFYGVTFFLFGFFNHLQVMGNDIPLWGYDLIHISNYILYGSYLVCLVTATPKAQPTHG